MKVVSNDRFTHYTDDDLLEEIGRQSIGTQIASDLVAARALSPDIPVGLNALDDLRELGSKVFSRIAHELYTVVCGSGEADENDRKKILGAVGVTEAVVQASIVSVMTSALGLGPGLSAAVAALVLRRIILPAGDEVCRFWHDRHL